jgi:hypothetical protein
MDGPLPVSALNSEVDGARSEVMAKFTKAELFWRGAAVKGCFIQ